MRVSGFSPATSGAATGCGVGRPNGSRAGAGPWRVFGRIALPLAAQGLGAASAVALARGLGEFGATIIFAGSLQGVTQTLPLAIYAQFEQDFDVALAIGALFVLVGVCLLLAFRLLGWARSISTSPFRPVASSSV